MTEEVKKQKFTTSLRDTSRIDLAAIALASGKNLNEVLEEMIEIKKRDIILNKYDNDASKFEAVRDIAKVKYMDKKKK